MEPLTIYNIDISLLLCHTKGMYNGIQLELLKLKGRNQNDKLKNHTNLSLKFIEYIISYDYDNTNLKFEMLILNK